MEFEMTPQKYAIIAHLKFQTIHLDSFGAVICGHMDQRTTVGATYLYSYERS